ncbi:MAG: peptidase domain-containing ABC transporter [Beijerinckiaceae bacterium]
MASGNHEQLNRAFWRENGWRQIMLILRRYRRCVAAILISTLGIYASSLSVPIVIKNIIDGITSGKSALLVSILGLVAITLAIIDVQLADVRRWLVIYLGQRVDRHISLQIMKHVLGARLDDANRNTGEILNRTEQADKIKTFLIDLIPTSIFDIGGALIAACLIFAYSAYCGLAVALITAGAFWQSKKILSTYYARVFTQFKLVSDRQGNMAETVSGLPTIKALAMERGRFRLWDAKTEALINTYSGTANIMRRFFRVTRLSQHVLTLSVVGIGGVELMQGLLSVGEVFAILMLTGKISSPLLNSSDVVRQTQEVAVAVSELGALLEVQQERANVPVPLCIPLQGAIEFRNVTYRYSAKASPAISGLTLQLPSEGFIAIIGRNGSGKSTLLRLAQGLLREFEGEILVDGIDVRSFHPRWLRSQMAVVNQDTVLFAGTVRENVTCWSSGVTSAEIEAALRLAGAWDFVNDLPEKLKTNLTENAANLSGGQRQRLSIARALLREPKIVLLDEPTAFLDAEAAVALEAKLSEWGKGRLTILVSHHLAATRRAQTIILMDKGKIVALGNHSELLESSALYRSLWHDYFRGSSEDM